MTNNSKEYLHLSTMNTPSGGKSQAGVVFINHQYSYVRTLFTALVLSLILMFLTSCKNSAQDWNIFKKNTLINSKMVIKKGNKRAENLMKYAPKVVESTSKSLRDKSSVLIKKEAPVSYVSLAEEKNAFPIDINVENMEVRTFMKLISEITDINILVSDEVTGNVSADLNNVPWTGVLNSILSIKGWAKHVDSASNIIRIHSQQTAVSLEEFERKRSEDLQKTIAIKKLSEPMYTEIFQLFYTKPDDVKTMLEDVLSSSTADGSANLGNTKITVDTRKNALIVKARKNDIQLATKLINQIDTRTKQVFIEAFIVEVNDGYEKAIGTRLGIENAPSDDFVSGGQNITLSGEGPIGGNVTDLGVAATSGIGILAGIGSTAQLRLELTAMEAEGLTNVISNPRVFTLNNRTATIFQGDEVPYETVSQDGTQIEFKEAGLKLEVTPTVVGDGNLMMEIAVNKDTVDTSQANPPITKSEINTSLITRDKSIVVIGGIYTQTKSDSVDKVPLLGDIPGLGNMFKRKQNKDNKKELLIFIAPRVI